MDREHGIVTRAAPRGAGAEGDTIGHADAALVQAVRDDPAAFALLYQRYLRRVYSYVRVRTQSAEDADDLTQQIFLQALDALPRYRGHGTFAAWLFRIARNTVSNFHGRRRAAMPLDRLPEALHPRVEQGPEAGALREDALASLRALLTTLSPEKRELLALRFAARLTVAEIAAVAGKSTAATEKQLARTLHYLQEHYDDLA